MSTAIQLKNITKKFKDFTAVNDLSFQIEQGKIYGFLGPNGSGKSTTLRMMMGLIAPTFGSIEWFGSDLKTSRSSIMKQVGCIIEKPDFYGYLSALENMKLIARANMLQYSNQDFDNLFESVGLKGREHDKVKTYSHGMKQRLGLAQALIHDPDLIILDEPNTGLDPQGIIDLRNILLKLNKEQGKTILFSSHILSEVQEICTDMIVIHKGKLIVEGSVNELLSNEKLHVTLEIENVETYQELVTTSYLKDKITNQDHNLFYIDMSKEEIPAMVKFLSEAGIAISRIDYRNQLEEYFLNITQS